MAFKRSAVRSRLSPPKTETSSRSFSFFGACRQEMQTACRFDLPAGWSADFRRENLVTITVTRFFVFLEMHDGYVKCGDLVAKSTIITTKIKN